MTLDLAQTLRSENETKELKRYSEEDRKVLEQMLDSELGKPQMDDDGTDWSLMTLPEIKTVMECEKKHQEIVRKRAEELRFYPDTLTEQERNVALRCLTYKEMKPAFKGAAIYDKNRRLQAKLGIWEKIDVRIYSNLTIHFSEFGPKFKQDQFDSPQFWDEMIFIWTERYFRIMMKHREPVYETPYYFLMADQKKRVLDAGAKLSPEEYLMEGEIKGLAERVTSMGDPPYFGNKYSHGGRC